MLVGLLVSMAALVAQGQPAFAGQAPQAPAGPTPLTFTVPGPSEVIASFAVRCDDCHWDRTGQEAVVLRLTLDGRYLQHLPVLRNGRAEYRVLVGSVAAGRHVLAVEEDAALTSPALRGGHATVEDIAVEPIADGAPEHLATALAPFVYARPDTVGRFTDVPAFMWYEVEPTGRGTRYRYSVVFTNEDGGTPTDRLMATWGRTTDIEYLYSVEVDAAGAVLNEDMQGPKHETLLFKGRREGRHPLLWVSTDNNMVLDHGTTAVRYAPAPVAFPLRNVSREAVMDAHPWLYAVMADELRREQKIVANAPPGRDTIPDPRRFVYLEACGRVGDAALSFALRAGGDWLSSDRGVPAYKIVRDGCFRGAVPLPDGLSMGDVRALRFEVFPREGRTGSTPARVVAVNRLFMLDDEYRPGPSVLSWQGSAELRPGGPPLEIPIP